MESQDKSEQNEDQRSKMQSLYDQKDVIVIDNGADTTKFGISGQDHPRLIIETQAGTPIVTVENDVSNQQVVCLFGKSLKNAKEANQFELKQSCPYAYGMHDLWKYGLEDEMQLSELSSCNVMIIDSPLTSKDDQYEIAEVFFEYLKVNSLLFMNSSTLSLFSTGKTTGLVIQCGHNLTTCVPVFQCFPLQHANHFSSLAGEEFTNQLNKLLRQEFRDQNYNIPIEIVNDIQQKMCMVAQDYFIDVYQETKSNEEQNLYELPDGTVIEITNQLRYTPTQILFDPKKIVSEFKIEEEAKQKVPLKTESKSKERDKDQEKNIDISIERHISHHEMSISEMVSESLGKCDQELQSELYSNIVVCGGSSLFQGFIPRLEKDIMNLMPSSIQRRDINIVQNTHKRYSSWIGGSMLASLSTFQSLAITKADYSENPDPDAKRAMIHKRTF